MHTISVVINTTNTRTGTTIMITVLTLSLTHSLLFWSYYFPDGHVAHVLEEES